MSRRCQGRRVLGLESGTFRDIHVWWIIEAELTINPDFKNANREELNVTSESILLLDHLLSILKSNGNLNNKIH